jgi:hypothetical protein
MSLTHRGASRSTTTQGPRWQAVLLPAASVLFVVAGLPVVLRGAPLADDFWNCLRPVQRGLPSTMAASWDRLGAIRPARFIEIFLTTGVCQHLPFGVAIAVPLALTIAVAWLLRGLLRDLGAPGTWPELGGAVWLLQPLGTEAALWPAALHVPLGLALALGALRLLHRGRLIWGGLATLGAFLSVEQAMLALPLAAWLALSDRHRRRGTAVTLGVLVIVTAAYAAFPGADQRLEAGWGERLTGLLADLAFYVQFPAVGLGLHSIPLALLWAFPASVLLVALGGAVAWRVTPQEVRGVATDWVRAGLAVTALVALVNLPVLLNVPRQGSPRTFAPTWLLLAAVAALAAPRVRWRWPRPMGAAAGMYAAGAVLSIVLSVWVRLASADTVETAAHAIARETSDGAVVAVCDVPRAVVEPAPRGAFAVHDFVYDWGAELAIAYYTGRDVTVSVAGPLWGNRCPDVEGADLVVSFDDLI